MIDTHGLPLKFVFHPVGNNVQRWYFDLTDIDRDGHVGLYYWDDDSYKPFGERHGGWTVEDVTMYVGNGNWIMDFEVSDACCPEVNDLL